LIFGALFLFSEVVMAAPPATPREGEKVQAPESQTRSTVDGRESIGVFAGLIQPIVARGGNVQVELILGRLVVDYSHGFALHIPSAGDAKEQGLGYYLPYSTGFGVGYRFFDSLDLRVEPKLHSFQVSYDGGAADGSPVTSYRTMTLGAGVYYSWRPFDQFENAARGVTFLASARYWPTVWSSLEDNEYEYYNENTQSVEVHEAAPIGIAGTPFIVNLSVGYAFDL
jgi:hypothetical protein